MAIILDGSTSGTASGDFAREIARRMVYWFVAGAETVTADALIAQLRMTHAALAMDFRTASASYVLMHVEGMRQALVLHAGDCLVGRREEDGWLADAAAYRHRIAGRIRGRPPSVRHSPARQTPGPPSGRSSGFPL
ncbi:MAG: hypothetical protein IH622_07220 [Ochrobactrum anthropi]|uniref:Uncharacterized protein n=1 Tax=Brucella anthropi TaxID=529 RepID=A0A8I0N326_BRUAN|nr:hypothetical protein [Brucella anthropi]MBE0560598.1 hypothetical protein [Brucella anthropi]